MITAQLTISLDGVVQAPGRADEDPRGGFAHGGWAAPYADHVAAEHAARGTGPVTFLFGRHTYLGFQHAWAGRTDNPFSPVLDASAKLVVSTTLTAPTWEHTTVLPDLDAVRAVDADLFVLGSTTLVQGLLAADLLDGLTLLIHPLILGSGARLFTDVHTALTLTEHVVTSTGVLIATYGRVAA